jgi:hypothetical protein
MRNCASPLTELLISGSIVELLSAGPSRLLTGAHHSRKIEFALRTDYASGGQFHLRSGH